MKMNYFETQIQTIPPIRNNVPIPKKRKFFHPRISPKTTIPHKTDNNPGPAQINGYATTYGRFEFAMNQQTCAIPHIIPLMIPGRIVCL